MQKMLTIPAGKEKELIAFVKRFNKILGKNGQKEITAVQCGDAIITQTLRGIPFKTEGHHYSVNIPDELLKMDGYRHIGTYLKVDEKWMRFTTEGVDGVDYAYINESNFRCDHCGKKDSRRKAYYFFKKDGTLEYKVLGKGCADAYFGYNCEAIFDRLAQLQVFERRFNGFHTPEIMYFDWDFVYAVTDRFTEGFTKWENRATSEKIKNFLNAAFFATNTPDNGIYAEIGNMMKNTDYAALIPVVREYWEKAKPCGYHDDFTWNAKKAVNHDMTSYNWVGIAAYAVFKAVYAHRHPAPVVKPMPPAAPVATTTATQTTTVVRRAFNAGNFIGNAGDKMEMTLLPVKVSEFVSNNPYTHKTETRGFVMLNDDNGNHYKTFVKESLIPALKDAVAHQKRMEFSFVIKRHDTYKGVNYNELYYFQTK